MNNEQEKPKDSATPGLHVDTVTIHASSRPAEKTALITPPKDIKDETLSPPAIPVCREPTSAPCLDAPFSPIRTDTLECGHDYEPLPYRVNIFEGFSSQFTPISWRHVYSPLQSSPKEIKHPPFIDLSSNEEITPKANSHADDDSLISASDVTSSSPRPPYNQQWPMLPPPSNYWYHQPYQYLYPPHHHPHPPPPHSGGSHEDQKHQLAHLTLNPKPPRNGGGHDPYPHAFLSPSMPYGRMGSAVQISYHPVDYIAEKDVTFNDVICGRGGAVNNHSGNMRFRQLISKFKHQYMTESKQSKAYVAVRVLEAVKSSTPPGRFLCKYPVGYLECGDDRAREKTKQALREGAAKMRKQGYGGGTGSVGSDDTASLFDVNNEKRGMSIILLPNERCGGGGGASIEEEKMEYQLDPKYSVVFEPPRDKKQDDDDLEPASKKIKQGTPV